MSSTVVVVVIVVIGDSETEGGDYMQKLNWWWLVLFRLKNWNIIYANGKKIKHILPLNILVRERDK